MKNPAPLPNEKKRLKALSQYAVLDTPPEASFDDLVLLAAHICEAPIALISLLDENRQWFKARHGLSTTETPREISFCGHAIHERDLFIVPDASKDERFHDNPLVTDEPHIRFYAGVPLVTVEGYALGMLCVVDHKPRRLNEAQEEALRALGRQVMAQLELRRQAIQHAEDEARIRNLFDQASDGIFHISRENRFLDTNAHGCAMLGYRREELLQMSVADVMVPHERLRLEVETAEMMAGRPHLAEWEHLRKDGTSFPAEVSARRLDGQSYLAIVRDLTERKQAKIALRESREQLTKIVATAPAAVCSFRLRPDGSSCFPYTSPRIEEFCGIKPEALAKDSSVLFDVIHPDDVGHVRATIEESARTMSRWCDEYRVRSPVKGEIWLEGHSIPQREPDGSILWHGVVSDITERKRVEEALRNSEARLREATRAANVGLWDWNLETNVLWYSPEWKRQIGHEEHEISDFFEEWQSRVHPEDLERALGQMKAYLKKPWPNYENEFRLRHKDGTYRWILAQASLIKDEEGKAVRMLGSHLDITASKQAEQHIQKLNRVYAVLSDINQTIVRGKDPQQMLETACRIAVEKGNFRMAWIGILDAASQTVRSVASAGVVDGYLDIVNSNLRDETRGTGPTERALRTGKRVVCSDLANDPPFAPWRDEALRRGYRSSVALPLRTDGKLVGTFNLYWHEPGFFDSEELRLLDELAVDISFALEVCQREEERQKTEEELRWRTAFFEAQMDSAVDGILVVDSQGKKVVQNRRMTDMWKIPPHIAQSRQDSFQLDFVTGRTKDPEKFRAKVEHLYAHPFEFSQDEIELVDGTVLDRTSFPVRDNAGTHYGRIWVFRNITEQRQLEAQLRQSQKLEAIGQLAGGVAHDFNNILAVMLMQADLCGTAEGVSDEIRDGLRQIRAAAERAANLTRQLLLFSRKQVMQPRDLDLNEVVISLAKMLQRIIGEDVRLQLNLHPRPLRTNADAGMLDQVLMNLVVNSRDAMSGGGRLFIETTETTLTESEAAGIADASPGCHVCLRVTDTGTGIDPENVGHIFEPFFTTKEAGKGTGLGLATVFGIVKQHGGWITVKSDVGKGTRFEIFLPAMRPGGSEGAKIEKPAPRGGTETILLVEDEATVRLLTRTVLERQGYKVLEAATGAEALKMWDQYRGRIQLLYTDIVMPEGISGRELAARLRMQNPKVPVIFTSGYSAEIANRGLILEQGQEFIQKPASARQLLEAVRRILDA